MPYWGQILYLIEGRNLMATAVQAVTSTILNIEPIDLAYVGLKEDALKGEVAVVTGSASNVGLGYARAIARAGAKVVIADFNAEAGAETAKQEGGLGQATPARGVAFDIPTGAVRSTIKSVSNGTPSGEHMSGFSCQGVP
mgnify:CR=1 FL=1